MSIKIQNIHKRFGNFVALDDINIEVPTGELTTLLGPSGCGKTTLLRIIGLKMLTVDGYFSMARMSLTSLFSAAESALCFSNTPCFAIKPSPRISPLA